MSGSMAVTSANVQSVMKERCVYYEEQAGALRQLVHAEGVGVENLARRRAVLLQFLAADLARDMSAVAKVRLECVGSPYYKPILDDFMWYLKDVRDSLRLYALSEARDV